MLSHRLLTALRRLGLQWRIMLYVTTGLVVFSAVGAFIALRVVQQSTYLVYQERLHVARMVARHIDDQLARLPAAERAPNGGWLASLLDIGQGYTSEVIDQAGAVMVTTSKRGAPAFSLHLPLVMGLWQQNQAGVRLHTFQVNGETRGHVIAFVPLAQAAWGVIIEQEADEALRLPRDLQAQFVSFGAAAALAGLLLAWVTTRRVVRPINALIDASQDIARGDLDHPLDISGEAEVGALARTFNQMRVALKGSREEIARWNRELEARVQQRTRELATLVESAHALTSTLDLDALFSILMKQAREVLPLAEGIALFLFEPESQMLAVRSSSGFNASEAAGLRFRIGEAIAGKVFEAQAPALLQTMQAVRSYQANFSVDNRLRFQRAVGARQPGTSGGLRAPQSALGVPLVSKETRIGALLLYNFTREEAFGEGDVPILQALADQAVAAIENARLYQEASEVGTLRELNRLKSEFAARASHELRTPLTSIKSLAETLLRSDLRLDEATRRELLRGIDSAANRLTGIVEKDNLNNVILTTSYVYDSAGRITSITDPRGAILQYTYDANGRTLQETDPDGSIYKYDYTVVGNTVTETKVTDPNGNT
ncbi:MAG: HAMP domain-containing protein, partial [Chloroflexi bacterium]|nr:HAMP domain-containing protein [Chloroflexota bacterium]